MIVVNFSPSRKRLGNMKRQRSTSEECIGAIFGDEDFTTSFSATSMGAFIQYRDCSRQIHPEAGSCDNAVNPANQSPFQGRRKRILIHWQLIRCPQ